MTEVTATTAISTDPTRRARLAEFGTISRRTAAPLSACSSFLFLVLLAIFAPLVAPHNPTIQFREAVLLPPVWQEGGRATFLLGPTPWAAICSPVSSTAHGSRSSLASS